MAIAQVHLQNTGLNEIVAKVKSEPKEALHEKHPIIESEGILPIVKSAFEMVKGN